MIRSQVLFVLAGGLLAAAGFSTAAQTSQPDRDQTDQTTNATHDDSTPLAGPTVTESETGQIAAFGGRSRDRGAQVPQFRWFQLLRNLDLRPDQREPIVAIHSGFQEKATAFRERYGRELRMIDQQRREARENGKGLSREMIQRSRAITAQAPRPIEAQQEIWNILDDEQQDQFREILGAERTRMRERRRRDGATRDAIEMVDDDRMKPDQTAMTDNDTDTEPMSPLDSAIEAARHASSQARADRRSRFLRAHQRSRQPGGTPSEQDKKFKFMDGER